MDDLAMSAEEENQMAHDDPPRERSDLAARYRASIARIAAVTGTGTTAIRFGDGSTLEFELSSHIDLRPSAQDTRAGEFARDMADYELEPKGFRFVFTDGSKLQLDPENVPHQTSM